MGEHVKLGAWARSGLVVGRVAEWDPGRGLAGFYLLDVLGGGSVYCPAGAVEPWTPRVGEWVRSKHGDGEGRVVEFDVTIALVAGMGWWARSQIEPCAPPASACTTAEGTSAAIAPIPQDVKLDETAGSFASAAAHDAVLRDHLFGESKAKRPDGPIDVQIGQLVWSRQWSEVLKAPQLLFRVDGLDPRGFGLGCIVMKCAGGGHLFAHRAHLSPACDAAIAGAQSLLAVTERTLRDRKQWEPEEIGRVAGEFKVGDAVSTSAIRGVIVDAHARKDTFIVKLDTGGAIGAHVENLLHAPSARALEIFDAGGVTMLEACAIAEQFPEGVTWTPQSAATRDHNAVCPRCGKRAFQGIGAVRCVEPVCDDPKTRMPENVSRVRRYSYVTGYSEHVYQAIGRGVTAAHPTEEGAVLAWREAVAAKGGAA